MKKKLLTILSLLLALTPAAILYRPETEIDWSQHVTALRKQAVVEPVFGASATRKWATGFEFGSVTAGEEFDILAAANPSVDTTTKRTGTYSLRGNVADAYVMKQIYNSTQTNQQYLKCYLYIATLPSSGFVEFMGFATGSGTLNGRTDTVGVDSAGNLGIYNVGTNKASGSTVLSTGQWYLVEFYGGYGVSTQREVKLNGTSEVTNTYTYGTGWKHVMFGSWNATSNIRGADIYLDDCVLDSNEYPGAGSLVMLKPNAAGDNAEWTPSTGDNYATVDEVGVSDADYVSTGTNAETDYYNLESMPSADSVAVVYAGIRTKTTDTSFGTFNLKVKDSGSVSATGNLGESTANLFFTWPHPSGNADHIYKLIMNTKPSTGAWTEAAVNALQIGVVSSITFTNTVTVSKMWVLVEYTPAAASVTPTGPKVIIIN